MLVQCSCHDYLGLTHAECGLYMFQKVHHVEEGAEVEVGAEAEKEEVVHPFTLVNLVINRDLRICVVIFIPVCWDEEEPWICIDQRHMLVKKPRMMNFCAGSKVSSWLCSLS